MLGAIINFLAVAVVVYFVFVLPMNTLKERAGGQAIAADEATDEPPSEDELLAADPRPARRAQRRGAQSAAQRTD